MNQTTRPYGCWASVITAEHVAAAGRKMTDLCVDTANADTLYWIERRPDEGGRCTIMRQRPGGTCENLLDAPLSARSTVYEYGGAPLAVHDDTIWFVNAVDQAVYCVIPGGQPRALTDIDGPSSYADLQYDSHHKRLIAVAETPRETNEPQAAIVAIDSQGGQQVIAEGHDFYASPRLSPAGDRLVWLAWNHPAMPWDSTELWQADIQSDGNFGKSHCIHAGADESLFGPFFDPDGRLYIVSDADDWWNIYRQSDQGKLKQLTQEVAEFGLPQWVFGQKTCAFDRNGRLYGLSTCHGLWQFGEVDTVTGEYNVLDLGATDLQQLVATDQGVALIIADAATPQRIVRVDVNGAPPNTTVVRAGTGLPQAAALSHPEPIDYPTADGDTAHALFYPPAHSDMLAPDNERPPLLIKCHGGPTGATGTALDARIQYWTSRGYAVLDVNYRGSTGYGRGYRNKLNGAWGVAEVADCVHGAAWLEDNDRIDPRRVLISGSSAGGYTVLSVLTFTDLAAAGASYYGIGDLNALLASTHKFESRYLKRLIGDDDAIYEARSPLMHAEQLSCPVLFLQGLKDKVVPPNQAEAMATALRERGVPVAHVTFAEEGHGFRAAANIRRAIEVERSFYQRVLGLDGAEAEADLHIDNL